MKEFLGQTELETVKAKALGVLDALESRYAFIAPYEGLATCLDEEVTNEVTSRVDYFMDQSDSASVKHMFDVFCPRVLVQAQASDSQIICGFLLYTYLVIEEKRFSILTIILSLLVNSEKFEELSLGYLNVQDQQRNELADWLNRTLGDQDTYCALFVYHRAIWNGKEEQLQDTVNLISHFGPTLKVSTNKCDKTGNSIIIFF